MSTRRTGLDDFSHRSKTFLVALTAAFLIGAMALTFGVPASKAGVSGQIENWENIEFGDEPGQLLYGEGEAVGNFGVDPRDGSTYIVSNNVGSQVARINKFSSTGVYEASTTFARPPGGELGYQPALTGIAVDHSRHRFYLIESEGVSAPFGEAFMAQSLLAYSTEEVGGQLQLLNSYALPATGSGRIFDPYELHADPTTGELVVSGVNEELKPVLQRLSPTGEERNAYVESGTLLRPVFFGVNFGFDVAADGTTYIVGNALEEGSAAELEAFTLPAKFQPAVGPLTLEAVPGFADAATADGWNSFAGFTTENSEGKWGPQLAAVTAPNGEVTLYWKSFNHQSEREDILIHGYSVGQEATTASFGGGPEEPECAIEGRATALAPTTNGDLEVFDQGQQGGNLSSEPAWGPNVFRFGPGGSGCPTPAAQVVLEAGGAEVSIVTPGTDVTLAGTGTEAGASTIESATWLIKDPGGNVEQIPVAGPAPALTETHTFATAGTYQVSLKIKTTEDVATDDSANVGDEIVSLPKTLVVSATGVAAPTITKIEPKIGPAAGGTTVTITGEHLAEASAVEFGTTPGAIIVDTETEISIESPAGTPSSKAPVKVTTPGGSVTSTEEFEWEAVSAPEVSKIEPAEGLAAGGTTVAIIGEHLAAATAVEFGTAGGTIIGNTETEILVENPSGPQGTKAPVKVTTPGGSATSTEEFEWELAPAITKIEPKIGPAAGGTTVTIVGEHLAAATAVDFGTAAGTVTSDTETEITVESPAGAEGAKVAVKVTTPGGSASSSEEFEWERILVDRKLTIAKTGSGSGTVQCDGGACEAEYLEGTSVSLTATPASESTFAGWSGGGCSGATSCTVLIGKNNVSVTAMFNVIPPSNTNTPPDNTGNTPPAATNPPAGNTPPGTATPAPGGGKKAPSPVQKLAEKRKQAITKCKKLSGKAEAKCLQKARQIGKPKKKTKSKK